MVFNLSKLSLGCYVRSSVEPQTIIFSVKWKHFSKGVHWTSLQWPTLTDSTFSPLFSYDVRAHTCGFTHDTRKTSWYLAVSRIQNYCFVCRALFQLILIYHRASCKPATFSLPVFDPTYGGRHANLVSGPYAHQWTSFHDRRRGCARSADYCCALGSRSDPQPHPEPFQRSAQAAQLRPPSQRYCPAYECGQRPSTNQRRLVPVTGAASTVRPTRWAFLYSKEPLFYEECKSKNLEKVTKEGRCGVVWSCISLKHRASSKAREKKLHVHLVAIAKVRSLKFKRCKSVDMRSSNKKHLHTMIYRCDI